MSHKQMNWKAWPAHKDYGSISGRITCIVDVHCIWSFTWHFMAKHTSGLGMTHSGQSKHRTL